MSFFYTTLHLFFLIFGSFDVFLLQAGVKIPHTPCAYPLGMENRKIPDSAIVASSRYSTYYGPERGRLNKQGSVNEKKCTCQGHLRDVSLYIIEFSV